MNDPKTDLKQEKSCSTCRHFKLDETLDGMCESVNQIHSYVRDDWYCIFYEPKIEDNE